MFGFKAKDNILVDDEQAIKFHTDTNYFGEHGTIVVTHKKKNLTNKTVRFVFAGMSVPPVLSAQTFNLIWQAAREQGYIPHHIASYGINNEVIDSARASIASSASQKSAAETPVAP